MLIGTIWSKLGTLVQVPMLSYDIVYNRCCFIVP